MTSKPILRLDLSSVQNQFNAANDLINNNENLCLTPNLTNHKNPTLHEVNSQLNTGRRYTPDNSGKNQPTTKTEESNMDPLISSMNYAINCSDYQPNEGIMKLLDEVINVGTLHV